MRLAAACVALAAACALEARALELASLLARIAEERAPRAAFTETRHLALLDRPLESSGELAFIPPHTLEKRTLAPRRERVVVDGDRVTLEAGGRTRTFRLADNPAAAVLVEGLRATLAGDLAALERTYSASLEGSAERWRLRLVPLDPELAALVERLDIAGTGGAVRAIEIHQADGSRSVTTIAPAPR